ncbi:MAG: diphthine--ammonia ligase [Ferruginibacter sp.]
MDKAYMNWSGGKDSALALYYILQQEKFSVDCLLTSVNAVHNRISMHGVRRELLQAQSVSLGLPLHTIELPEHPGMTEYETLLAAKINELKQEGFGYTIFGDIFLEDLRQYREDKLNQVGISALFPLWKIDTRQLIHDFIALGFKTIVVCVNENFLDKSFCGRIIDQQFINDLPANVDPCGENGEFHTFVFDGPIFKTPINFSIGELVYKEYPAPTDSADNCNGTSDAAIVKKQYGFWFCDLY